MERRCDWCGSIYTPDNRNLNRGWGLCCSKSCAAKKREKDFFNDASKRLREKKKRLKIVYDEYETNDNEHFLSYDGADNDQCGDEDFGIHD